MAEISIPAKMKKSSKHVNENYFIIREVDKDMNINLKDWFIQLVPPDDDSIEEDWRLIFRPRSESVKRKDREHG